MLNKIERERSHNRIDKLFGAYTAFIVALELVVLSNKSGFQHANIFFILTGISIPSLIAFLLLDYVIRIEQKREKSVIQNIAICLGIFPSLGALLLAIWDTTKIGAIIFLFMIISWAILMEICCESGLRNKKSKI